MFVQNTDLDALPLDELWALHEAISAVLSERMKDQMRQLDKRLSILTPGTPSFGPFNVSHLDNIRATRRKYPKVLPRYRNPETSETWSGRGKQPRWLIVAKEAGCSLDDLLINK